MISVVNPLRHFSEKKRASIVLYWSQLHQRERRLLASVAILILLILIYLWLIQPAWDGRARLLKDMPALRQQSAEMRALTEKAVALSSQPAQRILVPLNKETLEIGLKSKGLTPQSIVISGDSAKIQMDSVDFAGLIDWLANVQSTAHWQVVDANVSALGGVTQPGIVNATISLSHQSHEQHE